MENNEGKQIFWLLAGVALVILAFMSPLIALSIWD